MTSLTVRQHVVLRRVWSLTEEEKSLLETSGYFLLKSTAHNLYFHLISEASTKTRQDCILYRKVSYEVEYVDCSLRAIEWECEASETKDNIYLISVRRNLDRNFAVMLVKPATGIPVADLERFAFLE